jgi:hypothetical protein
VRCQQRCQQLGIDQGNAASQALGVGVQLLWRRAVQHEVNAGGIAVEDDIAGE